MTGRWIVYAKPDQPIDIGDFDVHIICCCESDATYEEHAAREAYSEVECMLHHSMTVHREMVH